MLTVEKHSSGSYLPLQCMFMLVQFIQLSSGCSSWNMMSLIPSPLPFVTFVLHGKDRFDIIYTMHPSNTEDPRPKPRISCWYSDHWLTSLPRRLAFNWWIMNEAGWTFFIIAIIVISMLHFHPSSYSATVSDWLPVLHQQQGQPNCLSYLNLQVSIVVCD